MRQKFMIAALQIRMLGNIAALQIRRLYVPLGEDNFKLSIDVVLDEKAQLPIPIKFGPTIIKDAVGVIVGWPKELVVFPKTKRKGKPQSFALADVPGQRDKFKEIEKTLPMLCKYIYSHVVRLLNESDTIYIEFEDAMFGRPKSIRVLREDILRFMEMREIGARKILVYMGRLYKYLKKKDKADYFSFVDPGNIPTCPIGTDGCDLSQHITDQLEAVCRDNICLIPYNTGGVKMNNASKGISKMPGFKILTGNLKQSGSVECRYCVMRYMKELVDCDDPQLEKMTSFFLG
ncbi:uncharacterized protein [Primulina eburnea]|uniref:uncharacterized protein n=1 Tax=Primulina eburnea TaxID=1245227 RepID=UPI003C6CA504